MDEELKHRFMVQKIKDFKSNNCKPLPAILCEMERTDIMELVRQNILFSPIAKPLNVKDLWIEDGHSIMTPEGLEVTKGVVNFGEIYIWVNVN